MRNNNSDFSLNTHNDDGMKTESMFASLPHVFRVATVLCLMAKNYFLRIYADIVLLLIAGMKKSIIIRAVVTVMVVARDLIRVRWAVFHEQVVFLYNQQLPTDRATLLSL